MKLKTGIYCVTAERPTDWPMPARLPLYTYLKILDTNDFYQQKPVYVSL